MSTAAKVVPAGGTTAKVVPVGVGVASKSAAATPKEVCSPSPSVNPKEAQASISRRRKGAAEDKAADDFDADFGLGTTGLSL